MSARLLLAAAAFSATSCIWVDNSPLRFGKIRGQVAGADQAVALVVVLNQAGLRAAVDASGNFLVNDVPVGDPELLIVATRDSALRLRTHVEGGRFTDLGVLSAEPAAFLEVSLATPGGQSLSLATVTVDGTQYESLAVDATGFIRIGPLGTGCYEIEARLPGFDDAGVGACVVAGETESVAISFEQIEGGEEGPGCASSGCDDGLRCSPEGNCVECLPGDACGPGLACVSYRCEGEVPTCYPCEGNWQCGASRYCETLGESTEKYCLAECSVSVPCIEPGQTCQSGRCVPDPATMDGCEGYRAVGTFCSSDIACEQEGLPAGVCANGICTFACTDSQQCPGSYECLSSNRGLTCQPAP